MGDFLQSASNAVAGNVSGPVDLIAAALRLMGVPVQEPIGGSAWMERQGLTKPVKQSAKSVAGETAGLLLGPLGAAKAPEIARGLLQHADQFQAYNKALGPAGAPLATVWHGSPHKFDKFDASKIGTGEGAQAYGHGLYLADAKDTAITYQPRDPKMEAALMRRYSAAERMQQYPAMQVYEDFLLHKTPQEVADNIAAAGYPPQDLKAAQAALKVATSEYHKQRAGNLYKVDLPDSAIAKMLDWDAPLSKQAPEVQKALRSIVESTDEDSMARWLLSKGNDPKAGGLFKIAGDSLPGIDHMANYPGSEQMSVALRKAGIPGIKYFDQMSRGAGQGTRNYVVFPGEEDILTILERNGVPIK